MSELKPCPCCSGVAYKDDDYGDDDYGQCIIICQECELSSKYYATLEEAVAAWNARAVDPAGVERVARKLATDESVCGDDHEWPDARGYAVELIRAYLGLEVEGDE